MSLVALRNPFAGALVPVSHGVVEIDALMARYPDHRFCWYLASKDPAGWERSTSRVVMNQLLDGTIYAPVQVAAGDDTELGRLYELADRRAQVIAINHTQPHKGNATLRAFVRSSAAACDVAVRPGPAGFIGEDFNGPGFLDWHDRQFGAPTADTLIIMVGVGGAGEAIVRLLARHHDAELALVDLADRTALAAELSGKAPVSYQPDLAAAAARLRPGRPLTVINATGVSLPALDELLTQQIGGGTRRLVDIRMGEVDIIQRARALGWETATGAGMAAHSNYMLIQALGSISGEEPPSFAVFESAEHAAEERATALLAR